MDERSVGFQTSPSPAVAVSTLLEADEDGGPEGEAGEDEWAAAEAAEPDDASDVGVRKRLAGFQTSAPSAKVCVATVDVCGINQDDDTAPTEGVEGTNTDRGM